MSNYSFIKSELDAISSGDEYGYSVVVSTTRGKTKTMRLTHDLVNELAKLTPRSKPQGGNDE